jgi:NitT/TauT family transport system permease protein
MTLSWLEERPKLVGLASVIIAVLIWSYATRPGTMLGTVLAPPGRLLAELWSLVLNGYMNTPLWAHFQASLLRTMAGFVAGSVSGIAIGLMMGQSKIASAALAPFFAFARPIPAIAYIPMVIIWFGIGEFSKILVIFLSSFLYVSINTSAGVRSVPHDLIRVAQTFGASRAQLFVHVIIPESLPFIFLGLKVGLALSWAVVVASELVAAQSGLGYMIMDAATFFRIEDVYVGIFLIGMVGLILEYILTSLERKFVHWSGKS